MTITTNSGKRVWRRLAPWLVVAAYLSGIEYFLGWKTVFSGWRAIPPASLAVAIVLLLVSYLLRAWRIWGYFRLATLTEFLGTLSVTLLHNLFNHMLPARSGEISFPLLLKRRFQFDLVHSSAALFWLRLLDLHFVAGLALGLVMARIGLPAVGIVLASIWLLLPLVMAPPLLARVARRQAQGMAQGRWTRVFGRFLEGLPNSARDTLQSLVLTWLNWVVKLGLVAWLFRSFSGASFQASLAGMLGGEVTSVLPFHAPGGIGTYEAGVVLASAPYGVPLGVATASSVNVHLFLLGMAAVSGGVALLFSSRHRLRPDFV